ncbi:MAG TPA: sigma 54-interacting transcriptional regulator [Polyangia bacterium]|nr:sigma 54-interacting transcriptional regulator [Polyangia bacterium]
MSDFDKPATTVLSVGNRAVAVEVRGFAVEVVAGPDAGKKAQAKGRSLEVGTHASADLVLTDEHVSRRHLRIDVGKSDCMLIDLGSTNGTRVGGVRVRVAPLDDGAVIECGATRLRFSFSAAPVRVALAEKDDFEGLLGRSVAMRELFALLDRVAPTDAAVLIHGETGTGKERVARAIHARSRRAARPFAVFDCAAVPPTLIEAELFGHEKGAFTGATERRAGVFERADGGTVFLDELGELALELQPKLLRVLESNEVLRVGGSKPTPIDARIVAASNRDLGARIGEGQFREDLYYRLAVVTVTIPPLRERREDIPLLASHFAREHAFAGEQTSRPAPGWEAIFDFMIGYDWPGNVRELRNVVERAVIMSDPKLLHGDPLDAVAELRKRAEPAMHHRVSLRAARDATEREYLEDLVRATDWDLDQAATIAEVHRKSLERLLREHRIKRPGS